MRVVVATLTLVLSQAAYATEGYPKIPEPMIFDMMRPLGAERGELEVNALAVTSSPFRPRDAEWAPEIEYAYADGHAIEFELPFDGARLAALKLGLQSALGRSADGRGAHGVQYLGIYDRHSRRYSSSLLYMAGRRLSPRWSTMNMIGVDDIGGRRNRNALLINHATFYDASDRTVAGVELNVAGGRDGGVKLAPQLHHRMAHKISMQLAAGAEKPRGERVRPMAGLRMIREF